MNRKKSTGYVIPHTHWDREWRYPIWENRMYLVDFFDELLDTLGKNPGYKSFLLDGQVIAVADYLEVRPEREDELRHLIAEGRIAVGPWYTLPDLYPISGESIVRNLLKGTREAERLGKCLNIGYESFGWGQPSQLPQIYRGFGIDTVVVSKNVDHSRAPHCEFRWTGADGTSVYATRLGEDARANFFMNAYLHIMNGVAYKSKEYCFSMGRGGQVYHQADRAGAVNDFFKIENTEELHAECVRGAVEKAWNGMRDSLLPEDRAMMDGTDSTTSQPRLMELLAEINRQFDDIDFKSSSLEEYIGVLKEKLSWESVTELCGELRDGPSTSLSANALMTRPHIKSRNKRLQNTLFGGAEPFSVAAALLGERYDRAFLGKALDYMLLAHPHDSINGVTQDKTVDDVLYRLSQAQEIAETVYNRDCQMILRKVDTSAYSGDDVLLAVFNPHPKPRREILAAYVDTPQEQNIWEFGIEDDGGNPCEVQNISRREITLPVADLHARPYPYYADRHCVLFDSGKIPAGGYRIYRISRPVNFDRKTEFWAKTRMTDGRELASSPTHMENKFLAVDVNGNGSVCIRDKASGRVYDNLNLFEDTGDIGDYWIYYPPYNNRTYTSKGCAADICLKENGSLQATVSVKIKMELPAYGFRPDNYVHGKSERSTETKPLEIRVDYTLQKGARQLLVRTEVDNCCRDHRMSVIFDTGIHSDAVDAQGHFTVDHRSRVPLRNAEGNYYNELVPQPMQNYVSLADSERSFGVITDSLGEYEARTDEAGTLALTLFRAVQNIICTEWRSAGVFPEQDGGQVQQTLAYQYALCPESAAWEAGGLHTAAERFNTPVKLVQTCAALHNSGTLGPNHSFYRLEGNLGLSAIKLAENRESVIVRLYNPTDREQPGRFALNAPVQAAYSTDLAEQRQEELPLGNNGVWFTLGPNKIMTIELEWERQ